MADTKTQIVDVPVSARPKKRSTGIVGLNLILDGGYPAGSVILMYGSPLSGIDIAAKQFWKVEGEEGTYLMNEGDVDVGMVDATDLHPEMYVQHMAGGRIVVDSLTTIIAKYGIDTALKFLHVAREEMRKRGGNLLVIVYTNIHPPMEMTRIMRAADIVIELDSKPNQSEMERTLAVHKIRDGAVPPRLLPFNILETGIEASTTSRVV